jgi:hypothetical protein
VLEAQLTQVAEEVRESAAESHQEEQHDSRPDQDREQATHGADEPDHLISAHARTSAASQYARERPACR